jgi:uncharacterized protein (TIGR03118 family)
MITPKTIVSIQYISILLSLFLFNTGCKKDVTQDSVSSSAPQTSMALDGKGGGKDFVVTNLVSDVHKYHPQTVDPNLVNAWGMAFGPTGGIWVSAADKGLSTIYDKNGNILRPPVSIPFGKDPNGGAPTGQVFNSTGTFIIPGTREVSKFIFATENGTIAAWASGNSAVTVADRSSSGVVYKGLAMGIYNDRWYLFATDFFHGRVDIYDQNFINVNEKYGSFRDDEMPAGYAPFNIRAIGNILVVTYAKQLAPDNEDDEAGPGNGYVNLFRTDGALIKRLASRGTLNSPWGIEVTQNGFTASTDLRAPNLLIGNFGDGRINVFDLSGNFLGQLYNHGKAVEIEGLWALSFPPDLPAYGVVRNRLYFTAGPDDESHGIFGYIMSNGQ